MKLTELIHPDAILCPLAGGDRDAVLRELVTTLGNAGAVAADAVEPIIKALVDREKKGSTGFGKGVAIPHARHKQVTDVVGAIGLRPGGLDFRSLDGQPVYSVVLLLSPADDAERHLAAMNTVWPNLNNDRFRKFLRQCKTREEVLDLLQEADTAQ